MFFSSEIWKYIYVQIYTHIYKIHLLYLLLCLNIHFSPIWPYSLYSSWSSLFPVKFSIFSLLLFVSFNVPLFTNCFTSTFFLFLFLVLLTRFNFFSGVLLDHIHLCFELLKKQTKNQSLLSLSHDGERFVPGSQLSSRTCVIFWSLISCWCPSDDCSPLNGVSTLFSFWVMK